MFLRVDSTDRRGKKKLLMLIQNVEREEPFTAFGLFSVNNSTLSGVLGTIATYIIVLVQFNFCQDITSQTGVNGTEAVYDATENTTN